MAAGLTIEEKNFELFRQSFEAELANHLSQEDCINQLVSDGPLESDNLTIELANLIADAGPWGQNFPEPLFDNEFELIEQRVVGKNHLKVQLFCEGLDKPIDGIYFNIDEKLWPNHRAQKVHVAYKLSLNHYMGRTRLQLMVEHMEAKKSG